MATQAELDALQAKSNRLANAPPTLAKPTVDSALAPPTKPTVDEMVAPPTTEPAATSFFDSQSAAHASGMSAGVNGSIAAGLGGGAVQPETDPGNQRPGEPEWNFNMRSFGSGFKPEAYDPTALANINDNPVEQSARLLQDQKAGIYKPIAYNPNSLMHINDSPVMRLVNMFAATGKAQEEVLPAGQRRDMRPSANAPSDPNNPATPSPYQTVVSNLVTQATDPAIKKKLAEATPTKKKVLYPPKAKT